MAYTFELAYKLTVEESNKRSAGKTARLLNFLAFGRSSYHRAVIMRPEKYNQQHGFQARPIPVSNYESK